MMRKNQKCMESSTVQLHAQFQSMYLMEFLLILVYF